MVRMKNEPLGKRFPLCKSMNFPVFILFVSVH